MSITFEKFFEIIKWVFSIEEVNGEYQSGNRIVALNLEDLERKFNLAQSLESNQCSVFYEDGSVKTCEVAIMDDPLLINRPKIDKLEDSINLVEYEINKPTEIYTIWALKEIFKRHCVDDNRALRRMKGRASLRRNTGIAETINIIDLLNTLCRFHTLKVTKKHISSVNLTKAIDSYCYTYMRNLHQSIKVYNLEDVFPIASSGNTDFTLEFEAPKKYYNSNLIDYYNLAISAPDPFVSFISYYHIIEYYYDEVFKEHQIESVKKVITSPTFSYKDEEKIFDIVKTIIKDNKQVREHGGGNEQQSLNYVLNKYINDFEEFKAKFSGEQLKYYQNNNVSFSKRGTIDWSKDLNEVIKLIRNRIYNTRNSLIHSKSSKKEETYHPYEDRENLLKEIPLIKSIAETIIEHNSKYI